MTLPAYKSAGAGTPTLGLAGVFTLNPACPATVDADDILILHCTCRAGTSAAWDGPPSGWGTIDDNLGSARHRMSLYWKRADGSEDGSTVTVTGAYTGTNQGAYARIYSFSGVKNSGSSASDICESGSNTSGSSSSVSFIDVTTTGADRLACVFTGANDDATIAAFTGESGGDLTEPVAEYTSVTGGDGMLSLQTADMASSGTLTGGTATLGVSCSWISRSLALIPNSTTLTLTQTARLDNSNTLYTDKVNLTVTEAARLDNANTLYAGRLDLNLVETARLDNANSVFTPTLTAAALVTQAARLDNANTLYAGRLDLGLAQAARLDNLEILYAPTLTAAWAVAQDARLDNANVLYTHRLDLNLAEAARLDNVSTVYQPTLAAAALITQDARLDNASTVYEPVLAQGDTLVQTARLDNVNTLYAPTLTADAAIVQDARLDNVNDLPTHTVANIVDQTITQDARLDNANTLFEGAVTLPAESEETQTSGPASTRRRSRSQRRAARRGSGGGGGGGDGGGHEPFADEETGRAQGRVESTVEPESKAPPGPQGLGSYLGDAAGFGLPGPDVETPFGLDADALGRALAERDRAEALTARAHDLAHDFLAAEVLRRLEEERLTALNAAIAVALAA